MTLALHNVNFAYAVAKPILREVNASFAPSRVTAIIGSNGAGKSTLLRLLAGLRAPDSGSITLENKPLSDLTRSERAHKLVYLPQHSSVAFDYTASEVVAMGLYARGSASDRALITEALAKVGIENRADDLVRTLSTGQQQRVTLARALAQFGRTSEASPRYLLADEPVSAMDPRHALAAMDILRELTSRAIGVVVILHDLSLALRYADDVLLLSSEGRVHAAGPCAQTLRSENLQALFGLHFEELQDSQGRAAAIVPHR